MNRKELDKEIFGLVTSNDSKEINQGLRLLYHYYSKELEGFLRKKNIAILEDDYGDIIQNTTVIFWKNINERKVQQIPGKLLSYLKSIAQNIYYSKLKKRIKEREGIDIVHAELENDLSIEVDLELMQNINDTRKRKLFQCLNRLSKENRSIITKYYYEGVSGEKLAKEFDKDLNWVNQRLYQNRQRLRKCVSSED